MSVGSSVTSYKGAPLVPMGPNFIVLVHPYSYAMIRNHKSVGKWRSNLKLLNFSNKQAKCDSS